LWQENFQPLIHITLKFGNGPYLLYTCSIPALYQPVFKTINPLHLKNSGKGETSDED
jgi:hypothetical protein